MGKTEIRLALRDASHLLEATGPSPPHSAAGAAGAGGVPGWLLPILQALGPVELKSVKAWIETVVPNPTPTPGK